MTCRILVSIVPQRDEGANEWNRERLSRKSQTRSELCEFERVAVALEVQVQEGHHDQRSGMFGTQPIRFHVLLQGALHVTSRGGNSSGAPGATDGIARIERQ